jgi:hypothetical protein
MCTVALQATAFWTRIRQLQEEDITVTVTVESVNKGGMLVKFGIYDGFVPVSQFGPVRPGALASFGGGLAGQGAQCAAPGGRSRQSGLLRPRGVGGSQQARVTRPLSLMCYPSYRARLVAEHHR